MGNERDGMAAETLRVGVRDRRVRRHPGLTPARARALNLRAVTRALAAAGIDHFVVRGLEVCATVVAVAEADRAAALPVLRALLDDTDGYARLVLPRPAQAREPAAPAELDRAALAQASVLRLTWYRADPTGALVCGDEYGCDVEFWRAEGADRLAAPRPNAVTRSVAADEPPVDAGDELFGEFPLGDPERWRTRAVFLRPLADDLRFPVDAVYTWVDGGDPDWQRRRAGQRGDVYHAEADSDARYLNRDELRWSLRSINLFAPWLRTVYLVTDGQVPGWLDRSDPRIRVVDHRDVFRDPSVLPVFNSCAIESQLHHIDGLSEQFLYLNDDVFLGRPLSPRAFFHPGGMSKFFPSPYRVPPEPPRPGDSPVDTMIKNHSALLRRRFGVELTATTLHTPHALRRSVLAELEREFPDEHRATAASRFRAPENLSVTYSLHHQYAQLTGRATAEQARAGYLTLGAPDLAPVLARVLARRDWDFFCLNDTHSVSTELAVQNAVLRPFLEAYFPVPGPFEKDPAG